jgi:hypothetical protein
MVERRQGPSYFLDTYLIINKLLKSKTKFGDAPWTPVLHDAREKYLFWIVRYVRAQAVHRSSIVAIRKACDIEIFHERFHRLENLRKGALE